MDNEYTGEAYDPGFESDATNTTTFEEVHHGQPQYEGEIALAVRMIEEAVRDNDVRWFSTHMAEWMCASVGLDPEIIVEQMKKRNKPRAA